MAQRRKLDWQIQEQEIAELKARLARAHRTVKRLRQENSQLQTEIQDLHGDQSQSQKLLTPGREKSRKVKRRRRPKPQVKRKESGSIFKFMFMLMHTGWSVVHGNVFSGTTKSQSKPNNAVTRQPRGKKAENLGATPSKAVKQRPSRKIKVHHIAIVTVLTFAAVGLLPRLSRSPKESQSPTQSSVLPVPPTILEPTSGELVYNLRQTPDLKSSLELQTLVEQVVALAAETGLPQENLSVSLINVNSGEYAQYQQHATRYPASVVKLFWMVALYGKMQGNQLLDRTGIATDLQKMVGESENDAASRVLDKITGVESGDELGDLEFANWIQKRQQVNRFFSLAGYSGIDISHKTYPVNHLGHGGPQGRDKQMRKLRISKDLRNQITTAHAARLMYEVAKGEAISPAMSEEMQQFLRRDVNADNIADRPFNPIRGYFGESLPENITLLSKAGWTSTGRHEVAYIASADGSVAYVLAIFGEDKAYSDNWNIFPSMSSLVFETLSQP